jgi:hypothetical protein
MKKFRLMDIRPVLLDERIGDELLTNMRKFDDPNEAWTRHVYTVFF